MSGQAQGGDDTVTGASTAMVLTTFSSVTPNLCPSLRRQVTILLRGVPALHFVIGTVTNILFGDAEFMSGSAKGGDDTLFAGTAAPGGTVINDMWGDGQLSGGAQGGKDLFVFNDNGSMTVGTNNTIEDFSQSQHDQIKFVDVADVHSFNDLVIAQSGTDTVITAGADQVTLHNFTNSLTANDFLFVG